LAEPIKRISVRIGGICYQLVSAENEAYTHQIAAKADEMIRRVMQNNPQLSLNMAAILALVNSLDELARTYQQHHVLESQKLDAEKQSGEARKELMRLREQNWDMKKEILRLNALQRDYEILLAKSASATAPPAQEEEVDFTDDRAYADESSGSGPSQNLNQTNLDDYLRENSWLRPLESTPHAKPSGS
jgi:cell division protein ZapA (FtsZ GTPase activity inhibitor)